MTKMNDDIDDLIKAMKTQFDQMRGDYNTQFQAIEKEFERERYDILKRNRSEIQDLFKQHKDTEEKFMEDRNRLENENAKELENVRSTDANTQAEQKIKLEKEMQILEKCMEDMKAVYLLNEEKLDFNYKVLTERKQVNDQQKKRFKKRKDYL